MRKAKKILSNAVSDFGITNASSDTSGVEIGGVSVCENDSEFLFFCSLTPRLAGNALAGFKTLK